MYSLKCRDSNFFGFGLLLMTFFFVQGVTSQVPCKGLFPISEEIASKSEGISATQKWGLIDCRGVVVVPMKYEKAFEFSDGVAILTDRIGSVLVSVDGRIREFPGVQFRTPFAFGVAVADEGGKIFSIDKDGRRLKYLFDSKYCYINPGFLSPFSKAGYALVNTQDGTRFVSIKGGFLEFRNDWNAQPFADDVAVVEGEEGFGVINSVGEVVIPLTYNEAILDASDGLLVAKENTSGDTLYLNVQGREILRVNFRYAGRFSEGLAEIERDSKWGFIGKRGEVLIKPEFDAVKEFSEGLAGFQKDSKWGFLAKDGSIVIEPVFELIEKSFRNGLAYVRKRTFEGYINQNGRWVWKKKTRQS